MTICNISSYAKILSSWICRVHTVKVELHCHLDGSPRITTVIELAKKRNIPLPAYDVKSLEHYVSLKHPKSLTCFLHCFSIFMPVLNGDTEAIERIAYELCEDKANNGVLYCETRYCPHLLANCGVDGVTCNGDDKQNVSPKRVVESVCKGLEKGCRDFGVKVRSILCCMRHRPDWSLEIVDLCEEFRERNVVGLDIAGDETMGEIPAIKEHIMAFQKAQELGISRTVHAGEAGPAASVHEAIFLLHANRIGHGYHVLEDLDLYNLVIERQIHLEKICNVYSSKTPFSWTKSVNIKIGDCLWLCPTSSILTGAVSGPIEKHPAIKFARDGVNFSLNTDDMLVCRNNMTIEFDLAFNKMKFSAALLTKATFDAARACFLPPDEKQELIEELQTTHGIIPTGSKSNPTSLGQINAVR